MRRRTIMKQLDHVRRILWILAGNTAYALAVTMFILPNGLITGGTTGLALFFYHQMGLPIQAFVTVFNVAMFLLGAVVLGRTFALTTIISTFYYPLILSVFQKIPALGKVTDDNLLAVIFAGLLIGGGIGVVIRAGASTGGMDIPPLVLHKKLGLPVSGTMNTMDTAILLLQIVFSDKEKVLYGILLVLIYTSVLNKVLLLGQAKMQVKIVTERYEEVNQAIASELDRGVTLFHSRTGHLKKDGYVVMTVVSHRELVQLNHLIQTIDPQAFIVIHQVNEVRGRGFTLVKKYN
ncbi:MAG: YitT family protein [Hungatella sp.]|nr:YitT family protein [Hungatella sp.]